MRQFIVLGYATTSKADSGECLYLGADRGAALDCTATAEAGYARKAMFELAIPQLNRYFPGTSNAAATTAAPTGEPETSDPAAELDLSQPAQKLADEHQLTPQQLAEITPSGAGGKITKTDIEEYLLLLEEVDEEQLVDADPEDA